ncbi:PREDICTED: LOW QUALITY PROTEIN: protein AAR2 homolog [Branchiostoma belcheri]|uniref:Protein AAR2 homolog n=1 Tax=Branchiostoma belcheri TaxID=7741 RepID=A0A6P4ZAE7_BRABE|nr:PREDICTED: LOW QUALITY PROTEIN: protein AAR2 homolog [Branchiostoma belcheri]
MEMNQETALQLFEEGAFFILLDVPVGTEFGIDYNSWQVGEKFKGVKMIPEGVHFVSYNTVNKEHREAAPKLGFFHYFHSKEVLVRRWDKRLEGISEDVIEGEELANFESSLKDLDKFLGPYPYDNYKKWKSLTNHITESLMTRLQPVSGRISSATQLVRDSEEKVCYTVGELPRSMKEAEGRLPKMVAVAGTEIRFVTLPTRTYPEGASPADITKYSMDKSFMLEELLSTHYAENHMDLLGELQFAFVCFMVGQVFDAFVHWKKLVHLLCSCDEALGRHEALYSAFISTMHFQLREIPEDFFVDIVSSNNFLTTTLQVFFSNLANCDAASRQLKKRGYQFKDHLTKTFRWDFDTEQEEDAPVVVQLGET